MKNPAGMYAKNGRNKDNNNKTLLTNGRKSEEERLGGECELDRLLYE